MLLGKRLVGEMARRSRGLVRVGLPVSVVVLSFGASTSAQQIVGPQGPGIDEGGTVHMPELNVPFSALASDRAKQNLLDFLDGLQRLGSRAAADIVEQRRNADEILLRPGVKRLAAVFPVKIVSRQMGGVQVDLITPSDGISPRNAGRVLINLHGGGFLGGAGLGGQMESIPIASLGKMRVISVNYRQGPEHRFPAASEDVATVYRELLSHYRPENIGLYGCSSGGWLTAESVAWFQTHGLPRPGAIGLFSAGALIFDGVSGDSAYVGSALAQDAAPSRSVPIGARSVGSGSGAKGFRLDYFDVPGLSMNDPLVSPIHSPAVLAKFPPTLIISGTRDMLLSQAVYTHAQLVKLGVDADLHIWEATYHCSFAQPVVDPEEAETREAWNVIIKFFQSRLGRVDRTGKRG